MFVGLSSLHVLCRSCSAQQLSSDTVEELPCIPLQAHALPRDESELSWLCRTPGNGGGETASTACAGCGSTCGAPATRPPPRALRALRLQQQRARHPGNGDRAPSSPRWRAPARRPRQRRRLCPASTRCAAQAWCLGVRARRDCSRFLSSPSRKTASDAAGRAQASLKFCPASIHAADVPTNAAQLPDM